MTDKTIKAIYDYTDESGELLYQNVRYDPKDFRQRRPDGSGGFVWSLNGTRRVLYRFRELLQANPADTVFYVEGEKDCDNLRRHGLIVTTSGAVHTWRDEFAEFLSDRKVCIIPDNDPPGQKLALTVSKALHKVRCPDVKILNLPGLQEKGDVSDWLENGGTKEKLLELVKQVGKSNVKLHLTNMAEIASEEVEWFWPNKIPDCALSIISGDPGATKSFLTVCMAAHISTGRPWPDCPEIPVRKGSVIFFSDEDHPAKIIRPRLDAHKADISKVYILQGVTAAEKDESFDLTQHLTGLEDALTSITDVRMIVLDPITAYMGDLNANNNSEVRTALAPVAALAAKHNITIIGLNHHNKRQDLSYMYRGLGSTAFVAQARSVWGVMADKEDPETKIFCPIKTNYSINATGLKYKIIDGVVTFADDPWLGQADDMIADKADNTKRIDEAVKWLEAQLGKADVASDFLLEEGKTAGFSRNLLFRAKDRLSVKARRRGFGSEGQWFWRLPSVE